MNVKNITALSAGAILGLMSSNVAADNAKMLEETNIKDTSVAKDYEVTKSSTVNKVNIKLKDTARSIKVLNKEFIKDINALDIGDLFDYTAGFNRNGTADRSFMSRGQSVGVNNVLMDGLKTSQGGEGGTSSRFPSTFNAESVDFLSGPSGTLYGAGSGFGLVNVNSKKTFRLYSI